MMLNIKVATGFKIQHAGTVPPERQFNNMAAKGGELHSMIKNNNIPFYVDRFAGGGIYYPIKYDKSLIHEYRNLLGDWFLGHNGPYSLGEIKEKLV